MKLVAIEFVSPQGAVRVIEAQGDHDLLVGPEGNNVAVLDPGLPPAMVVIEGKEQTHPRVVAKVPASWAQFPVWAFEDGEEGKPADVPTGTPVVMPDGGERHVGATIPDEACGCSECNDARFRQRTHGQGRVAPIHP